MTGDRRGAGVLKVFVDTSAMQAALAEPDGRSGAGLGPVQAQLLLVAEGADQGMLDLVTSTEAQMELCEPEGGGDLFFGATVSPASMPRAYRSALAAAATRDDDMAYAVLRALDDPRYLELRDLAGAGEPTRRQLFAALDLWAAEASECAVVLSCDEAVRERAARSDVAHVPVVGPDELLQGVGNRFGRWRTLRFLMKGRARLRRERARR